MVRHCCLAPFPKSKIPIVKRRVSCKIQELLTSRAPGFVPDSWWGPCCSLFYFSVFWFVFWLSSSCVLCTQYWQCLWVVHSVLPRRSCVPNVASVSGLYILYCPVGLLYPMLPVSLGCTFCIAPSVLCTQCCQCLCVVHYVPRRFSLTFV